MFEIFICVSSDSCKNVIQFIFHFTIYATKKSADKKKIEWPDVTSLIQKLRANTKHKIGEDPVSVKNFFLWAALTSSNDMTLVMWKETKVFTLPCPSFTSHSCAIFKVTAITIYNEGMNVWSAPAH